MSSNVDPPPVELVSSLPDIVLANEEKALLQKEIANVREDVIDNPHIAEAIRVLGVKGFRSAINSYWSAVIDDLRRKILHRSVDLFNKEVRPRQAIKIYDDFAEHVLDSDLIDGAYKIGVLSLEAKKMLHKARDTRNIFGSHPGSSTPSIIKVLDLISDCNRYVLSQPFPPSLIDISDCLGELDSSTFNRNDLAVQQAFSDLPDVYKKELANRIYSAYTHPGTSVQLRGHIEFIAPQLWTFLSKEERMQIAQRLDKDFVGGNKEKLDLGIAFVVLVSGLRYLNSATRRTIYEPLIAGLEAGLDVWAEEVKYTREIVRLGTNIPKELIGRLVAALTLTYVGKEGSSPRYSRTTFFSDIAAPMITELFTTFDDLSTEAFIETIRSNSRLRQRIRGPGQFGRLRLLGNTLMNKDNLRKDHQQFLELLLDKDRTEDFFKEIQVKIAH